MNSETDSDGMAWFAITAGVSYPCLTMKRFNLL